MGAGYPGLSGKCPNECLSEIESFAILLISAPWLVLVICLANVDSKSDTNILCSGVLQSWHQCQNTNDVTANDIWLLQQVQNNAARFVLQAPRRSHSWPLLCQLHSSED